MGKGRGLLRRRIKKYFEPLLELRGIGWRAKRSKKEKEMFVQGFDIHNTLSIKETSGDNNLKIKLLELFKIFYDETGLAKTTIEAYLTRIA